ncbi:AsmA-like C-terminal region-containing protein [Hahella sp. SMD15-11]|uniref:AsmA-like C-terminal region-containing protein n=1 Tax=Thermohahella caldifontis TaxID=3142973 RepID=A0AB39V059_9GAMM
MALTRRVLIASGLNGILSEKLAAYEPEGWVRDLSIQAPFQGAFRVEGRLDDINVRAVGGAPAARHIDGVFRVEPDGGWVQFNSDRLSLAFPDLYGNGWRFRAASGRVQWRTAPSALRIWGEALDLRPEHGGRIQGRFEWSEDVLPARFMLDLGIRDLPVAQVVNYVPDRAVSPGLMHWLRSALRQGSVTYAHYRYDAYLGPGSRPEDRRSLLRARVADLNLEFSDKWPALEVPEAEIALSDGELSARVPAGRLGGTDIRGMQVSLNREATGTRVVEVRGTGHLDMDAQAWWLTASPLAGSLPAGLAALRYEPGLKLPFEVTLPMSGDAPPQVRLQGILEGGRLTGLPDPVASLDNVTGVLSYDSRTGVTSNPIHSEWQGLALKGVLASADWPKSHEIRLDIDTQADMAWIRKQWPGPWAQHLTGEAPLSLSLRFGGETPLRLVIRSSLESIASNWPDPLSKSTGQAAPLELVMQQSPAGTQWSGRLTNGSREMLLNARKDDSGWRIRLGMAGEPLPLGGLEPGTLVIHVPALDGKAWKEALEGLAGGPPSGTLSRYRLETDEFRYSALKLQHLVADWVPENKGWNLNVAARGLEGVINRKEGSLPEIRLSQADLDQILGKQKPDIQGTDPRRWPALDIAVEKLHWQGLDLGSWQTRLEPVDDGLFARDIVIRLAGSETKGSLHWVYTPSNAQHSTILTFETQGEDFSALSEALHWQAPLTSRQYKFVSSLVWMGPPDKFELSQLFGRFDVEMEEGVIRDVASSTNIFRLLGVLNTDTLVRRLKLDFSDLYAKGMTYDTLAAQTRIQSGVLRFVQPLAIKTPGSAYNLKGTVDLNTEALDLTMIVALPVSKNLPLAALLVGAPQVGGALFLLDKLLGDPLSKLTTATFDVRGTLGKPEVTLQKVIAPAGAERDKE